MEESNLHISPRTYEMYKDFCKTLKENQPNFLVKSLKKIKDAIEESKSIMLFNFMSHIAFNQLFVESHISI